MLFRSFQQILSDRGKNPHQYKIGSKVIAQNDPMRGAIGTIEKIDYNYSLRELHATVVWNAEESLTDAVRQYISVRPKTSEIDLAYYGPLLPATAENIDKVKRAIEQGDERLQAQRRAEEDRRRRAEEEEARQQQRTATRAERASQIDTRGLAVGQDVSVTGGVFSGRTGKITEFRLVRHALGNQVTMAMVAGTSGSNLVDVRLLRPI